MDSERTRRLRIEQFEQFFIVAPRPSHPTQSRNACGSMLVKASYACDAGKVSTEVSIGAGEGAQLAAHPLRSIVLGEVHPFTGLKRGWPSLRIECATARD